MHTIAHMCTCAHAMMTNHDVILELSNEMVRLFTNNQENPNNYINMINLPVAS